MVLHAKAIFFLESVAPVTSVLDFAIAAESEAASDLVAIEVRVAPDKSALKIIETTNPLLGGHKNYPLEPQGFRNFVENLNALVFFVELNEIFNGAFFFKVPVVRVDFAGNDFFNVSHVYVEVYGGKLRHPRESGLLGGH